jgi:hypothetical protein
MNLRRRAGEQQRRTGGGGDDRPSLRRSLHLTSPTPEKNHNEGRMARVGSGDSAGDRSGDLRGAALGAPAGKGAPRPASPSSPLPSLGSRFWALSQSEGGSDDDEDLAPVEELASPAVPDGGAGRAPVTLGPFIDRVLGSPGWTRAGRGRHGRGRSAGARSVAAAPAPSPSCSAPDPDPDPAGSVDLFDFPLCLLALHRM